MHETFYWFIRVTNLKESLQGHTKTCQNSDFLHFEQEISYLYYARYN
jgi:hypothetical protein